MPDQPDESPDAAALAAAYRAIVLGEPATTLKQQTARVVVTGVEKGLVTHDKQSGLAVARTISPMPQREAFQSTPDYLEASRPIFDEHSAVEELKFALGGGFAQEVALNALGVPRSNSGVQNSFLALGMLPQLALVAQGVAPPDVVESVRAVLENRHEELTGLRTNQWLSALETVFKTGLHLHDQADLTPAQSVLAYVEAMMGTVPPAMAHPNAEQLRRANTLLKTLRVKELKPEVQPSQARKDQLTQPGGRQSNLRRALA